MDKNLLKCFEIFLDPMKNWNTILDNFFYDVSNLTKNERQKLEEEITPEGSIIVVPPQSFNKDYTTYNKVKGFLDSDHKKVNKFVIAGVGSSDVGGVALARNVADFFNEEVGAIVAGYGIYDLLTEGLGGCFSLGATNRFASFIEETSEFLDDDDDTTLDTDVHPYVAGHPDSRTLLRLLMSEKGNVNFILGHSKGCLSIANALNGFVTYGNKELTEKKAANIQIVTTGAVVELPDIFNNHYYQYLGSIDWFGGINSNLLLPFEPIQGAWHHTNTMLPFSMDIGKLLTNFKQYKPVNNE